MLGYFLIILTNDYTNNLNTTWMHKNYTIND